MRTGNLKTAVSIEQNSVSNKQYAHQSQNGEAQASAFWQPFLAPSEAPKIPGRLLRNKKKKKTFNFTILSEKQPGKHLFLTSKWIYVDVLKSIGLIDTLR